MSNVEKHTFQAEIQQLLDIVIHSLYTEKEIFLRELVSNAADACEKFRFIQTSGQATFEDSVPPSIKISTDETAKTITITDTGIGMTRDEMIENLGTIAHSGSKAFIENLKKSNSAKDASLIGQFGVGFYSAFMVASEVTVYSRSHQVEAEGCRWFSQGTGQYEVDSAPDLPRGTKIVLKLKEDCGEFSQSYRIESILRNYSKFVPFPIEFNDKVQNNVAAIWTRNKAEVKEEEYKEFYQYIGHDTNDPLYRLHFTADAPMAIQSLLFVPSKNTELPGMPRTELQVNLYCRKILIQSNPKGLLPEWMRFVKGVVDSEDLPLNISRETMQDSARMAKLNQVLTGRFLKLLDEESQKNPDKYLEFFTQFGRYLKEGAVSDYAHQTDLAKLLRFESSRTDAGKYTTLTAYVQGMAEDQKEIYFLCAPSRELAESSPYYEVCRAKNYEVLFLFDGWDEFVMDHLRVFNEKPIKSVEKAGLEITDSQDFSDSLTEEQSKDLVQWLKELIGNKIADVVVSHRLVDSPALVVDTDPNMTASMRKLFASFNQNADEPHYHLEINPRHKVIRKLHELRSSNEPLARSAGEQLFDNARVAAGLIEDPRVMIQRLNQLLEKVLQVD